MKHYNLYNLCLFGLVLVSLTKTGQSFGNAPVQQDFFENQNSPWSGVESVSESGVVSLSDEEMVSQPSFLNRASSQTSETASAQEVRLSSTNRAAIIFGVSLLMVILALAIAWFWRNTPS
eukprot:TRINITY_DN93518_c0_g1_i1.p1 TRINITY_DN93518_c0_g1~~TRINITY_DN93518_c0_g1_i1.p1  ORF type:complete len:120 (-),score=17.96 TRINITY_DN93518_c0_g1_i1:65-424(-)